MDCAFLGRSGLRVSRLCLGAMTFGSDADEETSVRLLDRFVEAGGNFIDTANNYGGSEEILGHWLKSRGDRDSLVIASKVRFPVGTCGPNDVGLSRKHLLAAIDTTLRRLQTDYLDLYQAHCWDHLTPVEETLSTFDDLVRVGKVRYLGASNFAGWHLMKSLAASDRRGGPRYVCLQSQYSLLCRSPEWELLPLCREEGVAVTCWSPLAAGWLTGKYDRDQVPPSDSRMGHVARSLEEWAQLHSGPLGATVPHPHALEAEREQRLREQSDALDRRWAIVDAVRDLARDRGATPSQVALAWLLLRPGVLGPVLGVRTLAQLEDNLGCLDVRLEAADLAWLDEVSDPGLPYPHDFHAQYGIPWR
jgi:aryl-alcohol dehydrogenase-like predicted oxidoreductase